MFVAIGRRDTASQKTEKDFEGFSSMWSMLNPYRFSGKPFAAGFLGNPPRIIVMKPLNGRKGTI